MVTLDICDVTVSRGGQKVIDDVTFSAQRGELVALIGVSGSGKTSLLRDIAGLDPIDSGSIEVDGSRITTGQQANKSAERALAVGIVFQFHHLFSHLSALDNVSLAPVHALGRSAVEVRQQSMRLLDRLGVGGRAEAKPHELSGGEAQRVAIARALAVEPKVLLMDEPTASLDRARREDLAATLTQLAGEGRTVVVATHDSDFARACAHRALLIDRGRLVAAGAIDEILQRLG
jgi:ABC-type polar amino acid transport system ATPase subunit